MERLVVGSRGSRLALLQSELIIEELKKIAPHIEFVLKKIKTQGDIMTEIPLAKIGDKGLFVKEIEHALLNKEIDLAVHSMKDLPTALPEGLKIGAVPVREDPRDALIGASAKGLLELPAGAVVGTGSLRRTAQLALSRPDLRFEPVRGNLDTRLRKLKEGQIAALVLACAGIKRLGWTEHITEIIPLELCLPAVGQGALGVEIREGRPELEELLSAVDHFASRAAVMAERSFLHVLQGGCQVPAGALGVLEGDKLLLNGAVVSPGGSVVLKDHCSGPASEAEKIGASLAEKLLRCGAGEVIEQVRREFNR